MNQHAARTLPVAVAFAMVAMGIQPDAAMAQKRTATDRVRIAYVPPKDPEHQLIYERLRENRALERIRAYLSPFRLPRTLTLKTESCDGVANAWYSDGTVQVCYEYITEAIRNAPKETTSEGVTSEAAIIGPIVEVFLHEIAHALFELLHIPVLGREEDAADRLAAYVLLQMGTEEARQLIIGVAYMYAQEAKQQSAKLQDFADSHGLPAQRFFNLLCMAYGGHPKLFADVVEKQVLPKQRAEGCEDEYRQTVFAFETLIVPHMHKAKRARVRKKIRRSKWLRPWKPLDRPGR